MSSKTDTAIDAKFSNPLDVVPNEIPFDVPYGLPISLAGCGKSDSLT